MKAFTVSAPGKIHLIGEHSVVYGKPALLAAVNKRCYVTIGESRDLELDESLEQYIKICLQESFSFFKKDFINLPVSLTSEIPLGSGMGSSAAIAVAVAGSVSALLFDKIHKEEINEIAFQCEKYIHGNPSGGDNATCTYGGFIWYQKNENGEKIIKPLQLSLSPNIANKFCIINTGKPEESTKEMVEKVGNKMHDSEFKKIIDEQGELTKQLLHALEKEDEQSISHIIMQTEKNLETMEVVSSSTQQLIRAIESVGSCAKVCGAGGFANASGIVLAFGNNFAKIQRVAKEFGFSCEPISLGEEGVRIEHE